MRLAKPGRAAVLTSLLASIVLLLFACGAFGQAAPAEKVFNMPKARVDKALQDLHASASGRLPTLDGFVDSRKALEHYERGFYQCEIVSTANSGGGTLVRVTAKITAPVPAIARCLRTGASNPIFSTVLVTRLA
jgi:hypothetical protein